MEQVSPQGAGVIVFGSVLQGPLDGANTVFAAPDIFDAQRVVVYYNGQRLHADDYVVSESGGAGSGFDTVTTATFIPCSGDSMTADYYLA